MTLPGNLGRPVFVYDNSSIDGWNTALLVTTMTINHLTFLIPSVKFDATHMDIRLKSLPWVSSGRGSKPTVVGWSM